MRAIPPQTADSAYPFALLHLPCMNLRANLLPEMLHSSLETLPILSAMLKQPNFSAENRKSSWWGLKLYCYKPDLLYISRGFFRISI